MFTYVYQCLLVFTYVSPFTRAYLCLLEFTYVYHCLIMFTYV